jgi:hypothetical protein
LLWESLNQATSGRLTKIRFPLSTCAENPEGTPCRELFHALNNPYAIGDDPALTQTCGWIDAWTARPSAYVVAAETSEDISPASTTCAW